MNTARYAPGPALQKPTNESIWLPGLGTRRPLRLPRHCACNQSNRILGPLTGRKSSRRRVWGSPPSCRAHPDQWMDSIDLLICEHVYQALRFLGDHEAREWVLEGLLPEPGAQPLQDSDFLADRKGWELAWFLLAVGVHLELLIASLRRDVASTTSSVMSRSVTLRESRLTDRPNRRSARRFVVTESSVQRRRCTSAR